jgi:2,3-bisphosphoglycerate-dependent phosphoglycerate mutase
VSLSRRSLLAFAAASFALAACTTAAPQPDQTIYLVRHAEKQTGDDPSLTPDGAARADLLVKILSAAGINRIYSTDYARTRETATPLAKAIEVPVELYDASDLDSFAAMLTSGPGTVLVVGHSNTTPLLVERLGGNPGTDIDESAEYDRLYVLRITGGHVETELRRYGKRYQP